MSLCKNAAATERFPRIPYWEEKIEMLKEYKNNLKKVLRMVTS
ncbi:MAG: hypothetical protein V1777_05115 [Candidatus Micrarchaeota archaeon]